MMPTISFQPFENLIEGLKNDGLIEQAQALDYLLHKVAWTTGSELLGELGNKIREIRKEENLQISENTETEMKNGMEMVKMVWPDFPNN